MNKKRLNLALQGGGAHGAFTWGVLDRLLEMDEVEIAGLVGTSAGAMNAAVTAYGLSKDGHDGARQALTDFWKKISDAAKLSPLQPTPFDKLLSPGNMDLSPSWIVFDNLSRVFSPYQLNPLNINPLREVLEQVVDFDFLQHHCAVSLQLCATNVLTGKIRVFQPEEITPDCVLASGCLPFLYQAVEIDGEYFWDGGYMGNPPIYPLIYHTNCQDVLIVQINPINIPEVPKSAQGIYDRVNTLSFNSSLMREMRAIEFVTRLIDDGHLNGESYKRMNIHAIEAEDEMARLSVSSKLNADWDFLQYLFKLGRQRCETWLDDHGEKIGVESSIDLREVFL
ncbi:MAG: patatin-like phospholipase family protein [Geminicoccaceae bacterium]